MAPRDYASRKSAKKKKSGLNSKLLMAVAAVVLIAFAAGLYLLKEKAPETPAQTETVEVEKTQPKSTLPSKLEERWNYIKELETREIPIDDSQSAIDKNAQLSEEQKKILKQMEQDRIAAELAKQKAAEEAAKLPKSESTSDQNSTAIAVKAESKPTEVKTEPKKVIIAEAARPEANKVEVKAAEKPVEKIKETAKKDSPKEAAKETKKETQKEAKTASSGKFGLQCGAFKNKASAEALQAKLAMAGFNARVNSSSDYNRVIVGPIGDKAAASAAKDNAKSIAACAVIGM